MAEEHENKSEVVLYQTKDGRTRLEVQFQGETAWLSLNQLAELFQRDKSVISKHIKNVFEEGELKAESVVANFATTAADGKTYQVDYYNLDVIISVGYRVKSHRGTQFRIWATQRLREYRCEHRQELSRRGRTRRAEPDRDRVSRICGTAGTPPQSHDHAGMDCETG